MTNILASGGALVANIIWFALCHKYFDKFVDWLFSSPYRNCPTCGREPSEKYVILMSSGAIQEAYCDHCHRKYCAE